MALSKVVETETGINVVYWKIVQVNINWLDRVSHIVLNGYISQEARQQLKQPAKQIVYNWSGNDFIFTFDSNITAEAYNKIKTDKMEVSRFDDDGNETKIITNPLYQAEDI